MFISLLFGLLFCRFLDRKNWTEREPASEMTIDSQFSKEETK